MVRKEQSSVVDRELDPAGGLTSSFLLELFPFFKLD